MAIARDDRWVTDGLGRALAGAQVYWCTQPASTTANPPSPLATLFTDTTGDTPLVQPVLTDGFGHAFAYMDDSILYTVVIWHPLFGSNPIVVTDQSIGGGGSISGLAAFAGIPIGTINGTNVTFTLANGSSPLGIPPIDVIVWKNFPLIQGLGYSISGDTITYATAPVSGDSIYAQGHYAT